ncbi:MAG: LysR family transcriptional regulator [Hyphomicrobium sp.]
METHEIRYFIAMVRELNFTRAAASCGITQPALTRAIKKLETELGGALFLRRPGSIELTRLAREILPQLEAIDQGMTAVRTHAASVAEAQTVSLRLGVMCTVGPVHIVSILSRLREAVPEVEVSVIDAKAIDIVNLIASDEIDVGIAAWPHFPETVRVETVLGERYAVAMREDDPMVDAESFPLSRLAGERYIDRLGCEFDDYFETLHGKWTIDLEIAFASAREDWIQGMLQAGLGYAIVPEFMSMSDGIVKRPLAEPEIRRDVSVVTLRGKPLQHAAASFVRIAKAHKWRPGP